MSEVATFRSTPRQLLRRRSVTHRLRRGTIPVLALGLLAAGGVLVANSYRGLT